ALFVLVNAQHGIRVRAHYTLDGFIRRKWLEVRNDSAKELRLLDVELDNMGLAGGTSEGGHGEPVFLGNDGFCAVEHPSGVNEGRRDSVRLWHCPAHLLEPGSEYKTHATVAGAAPAGGALEQFHAYLREHSPRTAKKAISIYTTFGLNNQWGACSTLRDVEALDVEKVVKGWQAKGLKLDFFTLDTGWPDNAGDLKEFSPTCYPDGPDKLIEGVHAMGMKFGMWFSVSWGGWSCGANPAIQPSTIPYPGSSGEPPTAPPVGVYRNGYPVMGGIGTQLCVASGPFYRVFHDAILHHVTHNQARLLKFDSGNYYCNSTAHGHLPGKYSVEAMHDSLIRIAADARKAAPDVFVIWYWGLSSPLWALHGDMIFESGLFMEGSGTSWQPALHYRDSVTLSLDQNTQFAKLIPPINKDSLGVWLSQIRWGNFMGRERWREAIVMDLGRGNLVFPQMWGDPYLLNDEDVRFLAGMMSVLKANERVFLSPRKTFGDSWKNEPYGYSFFEGGHGFVFANNMHFAARKLALPRWARGASVEIISHFPEKARVEASAREIWLRPFEVAMLEIRTRSAQRTELPARPFAGPEAYGSALELAPAQAKDWMDLRFAEAAPGCG
ncbi:MAG: alpha-galactosidase, partial [Acidobacteria bacterium]|nr:alpha-galactosidase [Acidobacteriota bacterium]